jgi:hypothetical protein
MSYNKTKIKPPFKNYVSFSLGNIFDYDTFQALEETSIDWDLQSNVYRQEKDLYNFDGMMEEVKQYLLSKLKISEKELNQYNEQIEDDIITSCAYAYESSYLYELFKYFISHAQDKVKEIADDLFPNIKYKIAYYSSEDKSLHSEAKYNTDEIRIYVSKNNATIKFLNNELNNFELWEIKDDFSASLDEYFQSNISYSYYKINLEYFDRYTARGDYDDYLECFKDYNEVEYAIKQYIEKKCRHTKQMIKNKVELIYR